MKQLILLYTLIGKMKPEELKVARKYLLSLETGNKSGYNKTVMLFDILVKAKEIPAKELLVQKLYDNKVENKTFYRLLQRLHEKLSESLLLDVNVQRPDAYDKQHVAWVGVKKNIIVAQILSGRGLAEQALDMFNSIIRICNTFEFYTELKEVLYLKRELLMISNEPNEFEQIAREITHCELCERADYKSREYYSRLFVSLNYKARQPHMDILIEGLVDFQKMYQETKSSRVNRRRKLFQMQFYQDITDYKSAAQTGEELVSLIEKNSAVYSKNNLSHALVELANIQLYTGEFKKSVDNVDAATRIFNKDDFNVGMIFEIKFWALFYLHDFEACKTILQQLANNKLYNLSDYQNNLRQYYLANTLFMLGDYKKAAQIISKLSALKQDREGWYSGALVLLIMCYIELKKDDLASLEIENFYRFTKRLEQSETEFIDLGRNKLIAKLLNTVVASCFRFKDAYKKQEATIKQLKEDHEWILKSGELIPFEQWFLSKVKNKPLAIDTQQPPGKFPVRYKDYESKVREVAKTLSKQTPD